MNKRYNHQDTEERIYKMWERGGYFTPKKDKKKKPYTILLPPPNANDPLHAGHSLFTVEDILCRYHRMKGEPTLFLPGTDHAGIETQYVFEKRLAEKGQSRFDFDRQTLYKMINDYVEKNRGIAKEQLKRHGFSLDWSRERYTLEPQILATVLKTFKKLHQDGLIYRGERIISWCPRCQTALSDLEVQHKEKPGKLYYIKYPVVGEKGGRGQGSVVVATTRPETMLGDTAVAVNPKDKRYQKLTTQNIKISLPLTGRSIPLITDERVDMEFGTGAVKVTPAHDLLDFEIGQKHKLPIVKVIDQQAKMTRDAGKAYQGLSVKEAQERVVSDLKKQGFLEKIENFQLSRLP